MKSLLKFLVCWWAIFDNFVGGLKVRRRPHSGYPLGYNRQRRAQRKCPKFVSSLTTQFDPHKKLKIQYLDWQDSIAIQNKLLLTQGLHYHYHMIEMISWGI